MDTASIFASLFARIIFAGFLAIVTFVAVLMTGFSADSGANPVFYYLCFSTLFFAGTGLICLVTPMSAIASGSKAPKLIFSLFLFSMLQPFLVFTIANFFSKPVVANNPIIPVSAPTTVCVSQDSIDPTNLAWIDIAIGDAPFERFAKKVPLASGQTSCNTYYARSSEIIKIRAYTATPENAAEYWTGPAPEDVVTGELAVYIQAKEPLCIGVAPASAMPTSWTSVKKLCRPLTTQSRGPPWKLGIQASYHPARRSLILVVMRQKQRGRSGK